MQLSFSQVLSNLLGLFLLILTGYAAARLRILPAGISAPLSSFLLKIAVPCTVFLSLLRPYDPAFLTDMLTVLVLALFILLSGYFLSRLLARLCGVRQGRRGIWAFGAAFSNFGFMGFPIVLALFGEDGLALAAIFGLATNLLVYSLGAWGIRSDAGAGQASGKKVKWTSVLLSPINFGTLLGLVFYFARWSLPTPILTPVTHLGNLTTPLSMIIIGIDISRTRVRDTLRDRDALTASAARLVVMPLYTFAVLKAANLLFPFSDPLIFGVVFLLCAMPAAAVTAILAEDYGINQELGSRIVFLSSLFSILTLPIMTLLI
ncbi:MAG: AEC family transporter [Candidatus Enterenecus sp.]